MAFGLSNRGEELLLGLALGVRDPPAELVIGLYDEAGDALSDSDEFAAANSEPTGVGGYARQTAAWPGDLAVQYDAENDEWALAITKRLEFDITGVEREVDGWLLGGTYQADGDGSPTEHLLARQPLEDPMWPAGSGLPEGRYPLAANDEFWLDANSARIVLD